MDDAEIDRRDRGQYSELGEATGRSRQAEELISAGQAKLKTIATNRQWTGRAFSVWNGWIRFIAAVIGFRRWWIAEATLGTEGADSIRISWDDVRK